MIKCRMMALDLDGTLLGDDGRLSPLSKEALDRAISEKVHMVVASGRAFQTLPEEIRTYPGIDYAITSNGAAIYHVPTEECICRRILKGSAVREILRIAEEELEEPLYELFIRGEAYSAVDYVAEPEKYGASGRSVAYIRKTRRPVEDMDGFITEHLEELDSIDIVLNDQAIKKKLWDRLETEVSGIYVTASVPRLLEISDETSGKASAMEFLEEYLNISREETAAFGNADNDSDMLLHAAVGIAVGNASEGCKKAADRVARSNAEDGAALEILRLLEEGIKKS